MKRRVKAVHVARRQPRQSPLPHEGRTPRRPRDSDHLLARSPDPRFKRTPTGISLCLDGLTIDADHAINNHYAQRALVSVRSGDRLCYCQRLNLDDPHQRQTIIGKLVLFCKQAELTEALRLVKARVTPRLLVELGDACRARSTKPPPDPQGEEARRTAAEQRAGSLLDDPAILTRVGEAIRANGYVYATLGARDPT